MRDWLIQRLAWIDSQFLEAPEFSVEGGRVSPSSELALLNPNGEGEIVYTLNGPDPKLADGGVAPEAVVFEEPIVITENTRVRARVLANGVWSDLAEAVYAVTLPSLAVTEIMYNPTGGSSFEFIELLNFGDASSKELGRC